MSTPPNFNSIFWVDDVPGFMKYWPSIAEEQNIPFSLNGLLDRVTFAHDLNSSLEIVSQREFDLYILDADFPDVLPMTRKIAVQKFLRDVRTEPKSELLYDRQSQGSVVYDNFVRLYRQKLTGKKVVVHSLSEEAAIAAFKLNVPFYTKQSFVKDEDIVRNLEHARRLGQIREEPKGSYESRLSVWKRGTKEEFLRRYLI